MSESSFQQGFGGGCGLILGVVVALVLIPLFMWAGCVAMMGGCLLLPAVVDDVRSTSGVSHKQPIEEEQPVSIQGTDYDVSDHKAVEAEDHFRIWEDVTGRFTVEAKFVRYEDDLVTIERRDGVEVTLPIDRLSDEDKQWVLSQ